MIDEPKAADGGILGRFRGFYRAIRAYIRSDEARAKLDEVKQKSVGAAKAASAGAGRFGERAVTAAGRIKDRADVFSRSEGVHAVRAKAKEGWEEITSRGHGGVRLAEYRIVVALAVLICFPVGLFLLWRHPVLGRSRTWWWAGGLWGVAMSLVLVSKGRAPDQRGPSASRTSASTEAATKANPPSLPALDFAGTDYQRGPGGEKLEAKTYYEMREVEDYGRQHYSGRNPIWFVETGYRDGAGEYRRHGLQAGFYDERRKERFSEKYWFAGRLHGESKEWYSGDRKKWQGFFVDGKGEGTYHAWHPNGNLKEEGIFRLGELEGEAKGWHANGNINYIYNYAVGRQHGRLAAWHENGTKAFEGECHHGVPVGKHVAWHEDGTPKSEESYEDGKLHGPFIEWTGGRRSETLFERGKVVYVPGRSTVRAFFTKMKESALDIRGASIGSYVFGSQDGFIRIFGEPDAGQVNRRMNPDAKYEWLYRCTDGVVRMKVCNGLSFFVEDARAAG